ncbi:5-methyltetrahydropteroyltriglutamate--homocysteine S-methyltransferase [Pullulanibacillus sp. KACC 23026]|uniref:5-methyltetrahydropteroyltriglutamate-- homocysteine S-methyltransferase n=1 Tax=Pullulanibacillus sp. KACC 23026 TaxID=3028315 RepID=UPI0023B02015|nr:5-methyltetrahydropteroyltriglutamate--homocysteine S-methyltransferase [Pullulanibacillus sp. KACC 23026]WEG11810.1 5-methyltetrahydropteroyltriglutamate--homocysteine S-methyltransferase [Pullulanibacillus sp. KACC 23026]
MTHSNTANSLIRTIAPFRADQVGSLLRPQAIKEARLKKASGEISLQDLREIENREIKRVIEKQKEIGLKAVTDGEFRRAYWHFDFLENLVGCEGYEPDEGLKFHGTESKPHGVKITGKLDFGNHPMLDDFRFVQDHAGEHTAKMTIPSPNMLHARAKIEYEPYQDTALLLNDLAIAYQKGIQAFYEAGCRYLQLDDTSWAIFFSESGLEKIRSMGQEPAELRALYAKAINDAIAKKPDDMVITMHICRGNFQSTFMSSGGYEGASETIFSELNVDGLFLEFDDERSGGFEPLRFVNRPSLQVVLGLITSKFGELENPDDIKRRIEAASKYVGLDQLCLSPQCGFASTEEGNRLTEEQQWAKLSHVINIAQDVWK